jgi:hypothetical protein
MNREVHVRICEGRRVRLPPATRRLRVQSVPRGGGEVTEEVSDGAGGWGARADPDRAQVASQVQVGDDNGAEPTHLEVIGHREPTHHGRARAREHRGPNRCGRGQFEHRCCLFE